MMNIDGTDFLCSTDVVIDSNESLPCLCGLKGTTVTFVSVFEIQTCPFVEACGCCPGAFERCIAANNSQEFCEDKICTSQLSCDGTCDGAAPVVDECGIPCGDGTICSEEDLENITIIVCLYFDLCGVCGGNGQACSGCDGVPNSGAENGVDCETGAVLCMGTPEEDCPVPVAVTVTASVVGGAAAGVSLVALTALSALILAALLRRAHFQDAVCAAYDDCIEDQLVACQINPLAQGQGQCFEVNLEDLDIFDAE
jgi:hypothetical protein